MGIKDWKKKYGRRAQNTKRKHVERGAQYLTEKMEKKQERLNAWIEDPEKQVQACNEIGNMIDESLERLPDYEGGSDETKSEAQKQLEEMQNDLKVLKDTIESEDPVSDEEKEMFRDHVDYLISEGIKSVEKQKKKEME